MLYSIVDIPYKPMNLNQQSSTVTTTEVDLDTFLELPGPTGNSVVTPGDENKPGFLDAPKDGLDFLDNSGEEPKQPEVKTDLSDILDEEIKPQEEETENKPEDKESGRPKTDKSSIVSFLEKKIKAGDFFAFDDYDDKTDIKDYLNSLSNKDLEDLVEENINHYKETVSKEVPQQLFESLSPELQYALRYELEGGDDPKMVFKALAQIQEVREMSVDDEEGQKAIIRQYLQTTNFGTPEEIQEEIDTWAELGTLKSKAEKFKPKLDQMQEEQLKSQIEQQAQLKAQQQEAANKYIKSVYDALKPGEINGLKLDRKIQSTLYEGLVNANYPSVSGKQTNLLGHLLEKYQFIEPNQPLIAETLWLLSDPEGYRKTLIQQGKNQQLEKVTKQLKTEQNNRSTGSMEGEQEKGTRKIQRNKRGFFDKF